MPNDSTLSTFNSYLNPVADRLRDDALSLWGAAGRVADRVADKVDATVQSAKYGARETVASIHKLQDATGIPYYIPPLGLQEKAIEYVGHVLPETKSKSAEPGYNMSFPKDDAAHKDYKTEWWYYVGHLKDDAGHRYGYELTFFRHKLFSQDFYSAHLALTDVDGQSFQFKERSSVTQPLAAGASNNSYYVWNGSWRAGEKNNKHFLEAGSSDFSIKLDLDSIGNPTLHGQKGFSRKGSDAGQATYYYSRPNMPTEGIITKNGVKTHVRGSSWMDHEFGSDIMGKEQAGWNWYSVQLENNSQLMLYMLRKSDGSIDENSSGTIINADGSTKHLKRGDFQVKATGSWQSPITKATYPMGWDVSIPSEKLDLSITPHVKNQELRTQRSVGLAYWEGACDVKASQNGKAINGNAYVELTGYERPFSSLPAQIRP